MKRLINLTRDLYWCAHGCKATVARDLGEVRKPIPQQICIVKRISGRDITSPTDFPILIEADRIKRAYIRTGTKKMVEINKPNNIENTETRTVNGGAK